MKERKKYISVHIGQLKRNIKIKLMKSEQVHLRNLKIYSYKVNLFLYIILD